MASPPPTKVLSSMSGPIGSNHRDAKPAASRIASSRARTPSTKARQARIARPTAPRPVSAGSRFRLSGASAGDSGWRTIAATVASRSMPALDSANSGITTNPTQGVSRCSMRCWGLCTAAADRSIETFERENHDTLPHPGRHREPAAPRQRPMGCCCGAGDFAAPPIAQRHGELEGPVAGGHFLGAADHRHRRPAGQLAPRLRPGRRPSGRRSSASRR